MSFEDDWHARAEAFAAAEPGGTIAFVGKDGETRTQTISGVSYQSGQPSRMVPLSRWQQIIRWFTPRRWRKPREYTPPTLPTVTLHSDEPTWVVERAHKQVTKIYDAMQTLLDEK
jgi:uncharacterized protein YbjT (DUF2867 family)